MKFDENTPRRNLTVQGATFTIPEPFVAGHTCTEGEASALNQLLAENCRNNFAGQFKDLQDGESPPTQEDFDAYIADYEFGVRRGGGERLSPEEREARNIAKSIVDGQLKAKNMAKPEAEKYASWIKQVAAMPEVQKRAAKRVKEMQSISIEGLDLAA